MIGFRVKAGRSGVAAAKSLFLDRDPIARAIDRGRYRALMRSGGWLRTTAKRTIRPRKGRSKPGAPPHSHEGSLRRLMFFGWDRSSSSVVVGPAAFKRRSGVPRILEQGGSTKLPRYWRGGGRRISIRPRPYMAPAMKKAAPRLAGFWRGRVH